MKTKFLILILFSSLFSCDFICPPEMDKSEDKSSSDTTGFNIIQIDDQRN